MKQTFSIKEAIKTGWDIFKSRPGFLIGLGFMMLGIQILSAVLSMIPILGAIVSWVISLFIGMGMIHVFLQMYDKKEVGFKALLSQGSRFWTYLGASIVLGFIVMGGMLLLIVPGIIASLALMFPLYLVIDRKMGVMESLRTSWAITQGYRWKLFLFGIVLLLLNLVGLLVLLVGLMVSVPVSVFSLIHVYRTLLARAEASGILPVEKLQMAPKVFMILGIVSMPMVVMVLILQQ